MISIAFVALAFIPLRSGIQNFVEKDSFKGGHMLVTEENHLLRQEVMTTIWTAEIHKQFFTAI